MSATASATGTSMPSRRAAARRHAPAKNGARRIEHHRRRDQRAEPAEQVARRVVQRRRTRRTTARSRTSSPASRRSRRPQALQRVARLAPAGVVERRRVERQRPVADARERLDEPRERESRDRVEDDARALRGGVDLTSATPGSAPSARSISQQQAAQRMPSTSSIASLLPSPSRAHDMARRARGRSKRRGALRRTRRRSGARAGVPGAQPVVVGEARVADPVGGGPAAVAAHGVRGAADARRAAARPAAARRNASSRSSRLGGVVASCRGTVITRTPPGRPATSAWRDASTIITMQPASEATKIAAPSQTTGCRTTRPRRASAFMSLRRRGRADGDCA